MANLASSFYGGSPNELYNTLLQSGYRVDPATGKLVSGGQGPVEDTGLRSGGEAMDAQIKLDNGNAGTYVNGELVDTGRKYVEGSGFGQFMNDHAVQMALAAAGGLVASAGGFGALGAGTGAAEGANGVNALNSFDTVANSGLFPAGTTAAAGTAAGTAASAAGKAAAGNAVKDALMSWGIPAATVVSALVGANASKKATDAQVNAQNNALNLQGQMYNQTRTDLAPWRDNGSAASNRLATMLGLSGNATDPYYGTGLRSTNNAYRSKLIGG